MPCMTARTAKITKNVLIVMLMLPKLSAKAAKCRRPCQSSTAMGESSANLSTSAIGSGAGHFQANLSDDLPAGLVSLLAPWRYPASSRAVRQSNREQRKPLGLD